MTRRRAATQIATLAVLATGGRPVFARSQVPMLRILCPYQAGGIVDLICRLVAKQITPAYAGTVIVENKTGAASQLALNTIKSSPPDGATIILAPIATLTLYPYTFKALSYDPERDFTPLTVIGRFNQAFVVGERVPSSVATVRGFMEWASTGPVERGSIGVPGTGDFASLAVELLRRSEGGGRLTAVAYRGAPSALNDIVGGALTAAVTPIGAMLELVADRKLRILAVSGEQRSPFAKDVPTFAEQGFKHLEQYGYFAFLARAGTPSTLLTALGGELRAALSDPKMRDAMAVFGLEPLDTNSEESVALLARDRSKWQALTREINFKAI